MSVARVPDASTATGWGDSGPGDGRVEGGAAQPATTTRSSGNPEIRMSFLPGVGMYAERAILVRDVTTRTFNLGRKYHGSFCDLHPRAAPRPEGDRGV